MGKTKKPTYDFPEATPEVIANIRSKIKKEQKAIHLKAIILFAINTLIIPILIYN